MIKIDIYVYIYEIRWNVGSSCQHDVDTVFKIKKMQFIAWVANCITGSKSITQLIMQLLIMDSQNDKNVVQVDVHFWEFFFDSRKRNQHTYIVLIGHCVF